MTCGLYGENREFEKVPDPFFKTTAIDHSAIPPRLKTSPAILSFQDDGTRVGVLRGERRHRPRGGLAKDQL